MAKGKETLTKTAKLKAMKMTDGKAAPDYYANIKTIDEILGQKPQGPFKATSLAEFENHVSKEMNLADMFELATRVGLRPVHDRPLLQKRLVDEFKKDLARRTPYKVDPSRSSTEFNLEVSDKARGILKEGS